MKLKLNGLEVKCIIGECPEERVREQVLRIDIELEILEQAAETDELGDTVDYAQLANKVRAALVAAQCRMLERAAKVVYELCRAEAKVLSAVVSVTKAGAVPNLASATVVYAGKQEVQR